MKLINVLTCSVSILAAIQAITVTAQEAPEDVTPATQEKESTLDKVVVTGTAIRGVAPVGSATVNVDRDSILQTGVRDAAEIVRNLPQASGLGYQEVNGPVGQPANTGRGSGVNLRGLGTNATLVLIDGHRLTGQGTTDQFADPNQIPFAALERVEVVTDGASAIYGSDAVAGVVNYIIRKDFDGAELSGRYTSGVYDGYSASGLFGRTWSNGSVMVGGAYDYRGDFLRNERNYLMQDLSPLGGNDNRINGTTMTPGAPGNIIADGVIYGLPATNGAVPTAGDLLSTPNLADTSDYLSYHPERRRTSAIFRVSQDLGDVGEIALTSLFSRRTSDDTTFDSVTIPIPSSSAYYIDGLTATPGAAIQLVYNATANQKASQTNNVDQSWNNTLDYTFRLGSDWEFNGFTTYGENEGCGACNGRLNRTLPNQLFSGTANFNPYLLEPQADFLSVYSVNQQKSRFKLFDTVAKVEGPIISTSAGDVRLAAGAEFSSSEMGLVNKSSDQSPINELLTTRDAKGSREVTSGFAEIFVPIVSSSNAVPGIETLNLSAALRYDDYSDFGSTTNPKIGVTYEPVDRVSLRGSWGTAFRAPTLTETNEGVIQVIIRQPVTNGSGDPSIPISNTATGQTNVLNRIGNTPGLRPEEATVWSLGGDFEPIDNLRFGVTYYNVDYQDRIEFVNLAGVGALSSPETYGLYQSYVVPATQPDTCVAGDLSTYNPVYRDALTSPGVFVIGPSSGDCSLGALLYGGQQNLGGVQQDGIDLTAMYEFPAGPGMMNVGGTFSKILNLKKEVVAGGAVVDGLDRIGFQVANRARGSLGYQSAGFSANLYVNYVGSYTNDVTITVAGSRLPATKIPAWTTVDANLSFDLENGQSTLRDGLRLNFSVINLTDEDPPLVLSGTSGFDAANANPFGRMITMEISKAF